MAAAAASGLTGMPSYSRSKELIYLLDYVHVQNPLTIAAKINSVKERYTCMLDPGAPRVAILPRRSEGFSQGIGALSPVRLLCCLALVHGIVKESAG